MSRYNTSTNHPIIPNSQEYMAESKFVSIHSEDRDVLRYPNSNEFEIELPQDYCNVQSIRLSTWTFPANYDTFSAERNNILMTFKITDPYNPGEHGVFNPLLQIIFEALYYNKENPYVLIIERGFYLPDQMANELTNKFNQTVNEYILSYISSQDIPNKTDLINEFIATGGYTQFVIAYNLVSQKLWFGNKSSQFTLTNNEQSNLTSTLNTLQCSKDRLPEYANWGLPSYLGLTKCPSIGLPALKNKYTGLIDLPKFSYVNSSYSTGEYWLVPDQEYVGTNVYYLEAPLKINLMGDAYFYMEIFGMNNLDETSPYAISPFTLHTNETNGVVNSAFAKIAVPTTPISQWFDNTIDSYKWYNPPAERIRKLKIKLRYHNGILVNFGNFEYTFTLQFNLFRPQIQKKYNMYIPEF